MKDLGILPEDLREAALSSGADYAWPLELAGQVIQALAEAGAVILGVEAWSVDSQGIPAVVGWSSYDLGDYTVDREAAVAASRAEAEAVLAGVLESAAEEGVNYVGIDWDSGEADA